MKKNYKIVINPQMPSEEQVARHMDFDALLEQLDTSQSESKKGRIRPLYYYASAAAAAVVLLVVFLVSQPENHSLQSAQYFAERPYVLPPIQDIEPVFSKYKVAVNQGGVYEYESGSRLVVPAAAFMDDRGKLIEGEVEIHYREMHDYVDFFLSGIPMVYDSANVRYTLESAGMIEIYAEKNGKRVNMAPGKHIDVSLVSQIDVPNINVPPSYNIYQLDTAARAWVYQDIDQLNIIDDVLPQVDEAHPAYSVFDSYKQEIAQLEAQRKLENEALNSRFPQPLIPVRPQKATNTQPTFSIDPEDFSILLDEASIVGKERQLLSTQIDNVIWEVSPKNVDFDTRSLQVEWEGARLKKLQAWEYEITYFSGDTEVPMIINRVLTGDLFSQAMAQYEEEMKQYQLALSEYEAAVKQERLSLAEKYQSQKAALKEAFLAEVAAANLNDDDLAQSLSKRKIRNQFRATGFGIWNCDRPVAPLEQTVKAKFVDPNGQLLRDVPGYLVDKTRNTVVRFLATRNTPIAYNTLSDNMLWLVTEDQKIALVRPDQFKAIPEGASKHIFELEVLEANSKEEQEIRRMLKF